MGPLDDRQAPPTNEFHAHPVQPIFGSAVTANRER